MRYTYKNLIISEATIALVYNTINTGAIQGNNNNATTHMDWSAIEATCTTLASTPGSFSVQVIVVYPNARGKPFELPQTVHLLWTQKVTLCNY